MRSKRFPKRLNRSESERRQRVKEAKEEVEKEERKRQKQIIKRTVKKYSDLSGLRGQARYELIEDVKGQIAEIRGEARNLQREYDEEKERATEERQVMNLKVVKSCEKRMEVLQKRLYKAIGKIDRLMLMKMDTW